MERTIDGIDYIAKSEVLDIINDLYDEYHSKMSAIGKRNPSYASYFNRAVAMQTILTRLEEVQER